MRSTLFAAVLTALLAATAIAADISRRTANEGQLVMEDVPEIPTDIVVGLNRYQNVRSARFRGWQPDGEGVFITTRFADVDQLHSVAAPLAARRQITYSDEPMGAIATQKQGSNLLFTRDAGGSEFAQLFLLDPATGNDRMLTDGESRNGSAIWDRDGRRIAYQSTARNGASNDVWIMDPEEPAAAKVALESPDGTYWYPQEFSSSGSRILAGNYVSIADSRVHLVDLDTGAVTLLAGGDGDVTTNEPVAFDDDGDGFWLVTSQGGEFDQLAWQPLEAGADPEIVTADIPWNVTSAVISDDRRRMAFVINENGMSALYLMDPKSRRYARVDDVPVGVINDVSFSPDGRRLAMTLNSPSSPSDVYILALGRQPTASASLTRWTASEVGGLDTSAFVTPELISFPTFDEVDGQPREIPAWVYKPPGDGPFPVIVSIHGGPEGQARPYFSSTYQMWVAELGAAIVVPNVRGSNGYGKTYLGLDNGFRREDSVRDIGALLDWIGTEDDLDDERVAVFGGSYGGYMVLASAVHFSDRLKAAVDIVGISSFVTFLENTQDYRRDLRRVEYGDERDPEMRAHLEKISPVNNVDRIKVPMFIVQGENDPRVPVTESAQMVEALREQGNLVWYMNALNEGHGYRKKENRDIYQQATVLFLKDYLVGGP